MERLGRMDVNAPRYDSERYQRQIMLPEIGEAGQSLLSQSSVLVVGAGGLGSPLLYYLAAAGVGHIGIVDSDVVSLSNLQRQILYTEQDLGKSKALCASERLHAINREVQLTPFDRRLTEDNAAAILIDYKVIVDVTDNYPTRYLLDRLCREQEKPLVHGAIQGFVGQVSVFNLPDTGSYQDLYPEPTDPESVAPPAVVGAVAGVVGSIEAAQVLQLCLGRRPSLAGRLLTIDLLTADFQTYDL